MSGPTVMLVLTTESGQLRLRLPAACVALEDDRKQTRIVRAATMLSARAGGGSVEVALFPCADDFVRQLLCWLRRREAHAARGVG
ncbi:MAG: hypothetical protein IPK80_28485 [Nannocystis sp.]|nr:hypothetical protein [Nannocystis sp.]